MLQGAIIHHYPCCKSKMGFFSNINPTWFSSPKEHVACCHCLISLVRVAMAVCCTEQHATPHSAAQHPCVLQHNATIGITYT